MEITKEQAQKWANALRSGKYKQGVGVLQDPNHNRYCCLGVACELFIPSEKQKRSFGHLDGAAPNHQPHAPYWLVEIDEDLSRRLGVGFIHLNDQKRYNFNEIADVIELVYVHRALDEG